MSDSADNPYRAPGSMAIIEDAEDVSRFFRPTSEALFCLAGKNSGGDVPVYVFDDRLQFECWKKLFVVFRGHPLHVAISPGRRSGSRRFKAVGGDETLWFAEEDVKRLTDWVGKPTREDLRHALADAAAIQFLCAAALLLLSAADDGFILEAAIPGLVFLCSAGLAQFRPRAWLFGVQGLLWLISGVLVMAYALPGSDPIDLIFSVLLVIGLVRSGIGNFARCNRYRGSYGRVKGPWEVPELNGF